MARTGARTGRLALAAMLVAAYGEAQGAAPATSGSSAPSASGAAPAAPGAAAPSAAPAPSTAPAPPAAPGAAGSSAGKTTPPKPIATPAKYPEGETEAADVVLEITVVRDGTVLDARVIRGDATFAVAALRAVQDWRFTPAVRAGVPVVALIRYTLHFEPPHDEVDEPDAASGGAKPGDGAPSGSSSDSAKPATGDGTSGPSGSRDATGAASGAPGASVANGGDEPIEVAEVVVRGVRQAPGSVTLTRAETRELPGTFGDPLRAIEAQPGVVPIISGVPSFFIRGAPPANVGFFIDGVDVPLLYHAFFGPSVLHPSLIDSIDFYRGASPAAYGRFAGPVVEANLQPLEHRWGGEGSLRLIDLGALVKAPFGGCDDGGGSSQSGLKAQDPASASECSRGSARVSGRYSYTGLVLKALGANAQLQYWDYQGQVSYALGRHDQISVFAFGAYDFFQSGETSQTTGAAGGGEVTFHRLDLRYDHRSPSGTHVRVALTGGSDRSAGADADQSAVSDKSLRFRTQLDTRLGAAATLRAGFDARGDKFGLQTNPLYLTFPDYSVLFPERTETVAGAHVSTEIIPAPGMSVIPGVRADVYSASGTTVVGVDPRLLTAFDVSSDVTIDQSFGIAHQQPNFAAQIPGAQVADLAGGLQEAWLWSGGVKVKLPESVTASAEVFRTAYFHALDPIGGARDFGINRKVLNERSTIQAAGLELKIQRSLSRKLGVFLAYTLSRSELSIGRTQTVTGFDRPHVLQAAMSYDFGAGLRVGLRGVFYSGIPELNLQGSPHFTADQRGDPYFRLDVRVAKRWRLGENGWWGVIGEVLNSTSTREVVRLDCGTVCVQRYAGPVILPSVGIEAGL